MYICIYVFMYILFYIHTCTSLSIHMYMYVYIYIYTCMYCQRHMLIPEGCPQSREEPGQAGPGRAALAAEQTRRMRVGRKIYVYIHRERERYKDRQIDR